MKSVGDRPVVRLLPPDRRRSGKTKQMVVVLGGPSTVSVVVDWVNLYRRDDRTWCVGRGRPVHLVPGGRIGRPNRDPVEDWGLGTQGSLVYRLDPDLI